MFNLIYRVESTSIGTIRQKVLRDILKMASSYNLGNGGGMLLPFIGVACCRRFVS